MNRNRLKGAVFGVGVMLLLACAADVERASVVLADTTVRLGPAPTVFRPDVPLPAADDINGVCVAPAPSDTLNENWTLPGVNGQPVRLRAEAVLTDSSVVVLESTAWSGELCLHPPSYGPLAGGVREIRLWASGPFDARKTTWISTHK